MCSTPKQIKNVVPQATAQPDKAPEPLKVGADATDKAKRKRNPLRIDLATSGGGGVTSGVTV